MTLYRATVLDTPDDPFTGGVLRAQDDAGLVVTDGLVAARGPFEDVAAAHPREEVVDLGGGILLPGLVDTHVHLPQVRIVGALGLPLLEWLERCALPEEARLADAAYAVGVADEFVGALAASGTTTALVVGAHFAPAVDALVAAGERAGLRLTAGLVVSDRELRSDLLTTPERARTESLALARRWHGAGRARYAVTPRFSLSCTEEMLEACAAVLEAVPGALFTSHLNENPAEIDTVTRLCGGDHYVDTYDRHGLLRGTSVLAHDVHPRPEELVVLAARGTSIAHCPTSNAALGSGPFPLRAHLGAGVHVALGSDVGAGTGFSLLKEGLQAFFTQQLLTGSGVALRPAHLLHLATAAGARALGLGAQVGDLSVGKRFDAVLVAPPAGGVLDVAMRRSGGPEDALGRVFALGGPGDVARVWVDGHVVHDARTAPAA